MIFDISFGENMEIIVLALGEFMLVFEAVLAPEDVPLIFFLIELMVGIEGAFGEVHK